MYNNICLPAYFFSNYNFRICFSVKMKDSSWIIFRLFQIFFAHFMNEISTCVKHISHFLESPQSIFFLKRRITRNLYRTLLIIWNLNLKQNTFFITLIKNISWLTGTFWKIHSKICIVDSVCISKFVNLRMFLFPMYTKCIFAACLVYETWGSKIFKFMIENSEI